MSAPEAAPRFVFGFAYNAPLGGCSLAAESRDFMLGLDAVGAAVEAIDLLSPASWPQVIGPLTIGDAALATGQAALAEPLTRLSGDAMSRVSSRLEDWLRAPTPQVAYPLELEPVLPSRSAASMRGLLKLGWHRVRGRVRARERAAPSFVTAQERGRLQPMLGGRAFGEGLSAPTLVVVDFGDLVKWGGAVVKHAFETRLRASGCRGPIRWVVRAFTETDAQPDQRLEQLRSFDQVWVPSDFHEPVFARARDLDGPEIRQIPVPLDTALFRPVPRRARLPGARRCTFLALSSYLPNPSRHAEWNSFRKATDVTIGAFLAEFASDEEVTLALKGHADGAGMERRLRERIAAEGHPPGRRDQFVIVGTVPQQDLPGLYASVDALIGVSRGEGWGRPLAEAMACGTPAVATRFGGNLEFMTDENSFLVDCERIPVADTFAQLDGYGRWAQPDQRQLQTILRDVYSRPEAARARSLAGSAAIRRRFGRAEVARLLLREAARALRPGEGP